jgi:PAS domain S-box-containing protein
VIVLRDVAERREAEEAVRRSTELLRAVVDNTSDAIFVKDRQGKYLLFNEAAARFVGRPVVDVIGRSDADLFEPESARRAADHDRRAMASGSALTGEEELTAAGVTRVYQATKAPYHDSSGNVLGVVGISRDVTDSKRAEEQLRLRDRAIRAVTQGILIADATRTGYPIVYVSPSFEKLTGYAAAEVVGRNCHFLQGPDTDPETVDRIRAALAAGQAFCAELLNYRRDGTPFWNELSISPVYDDGGRLTHFVGVQTDVTDRRRLEEQFRQSQKMESVGLLAGGIAHDFNNLLTIIGGYSRLLLREPLADEQMMMAREIWEAGERAATLTRQLLAFGRKQILAPEIVDLNAVVARAGRLLKRLIGEDVEVVFALNPAAEAARVDPAQLEQALINLAVNARDAMPAGGRLTISTGNVDVTQPHEFAAPGRYVRLAVTDTGCGMSDEVKARVFEPFFTTKGPGKGTGLGLSMVYGFVKQSGGYVTVASAPGTGTTFEILLPRTDRPEGTDTPAEPPPPPARAGDTILLVEDEEGVRKYMSSVLRRLGYVVYEAADGPSAVRASDEHIGPIHLLLTDVVMPSIGGRQLANTLAERRPGIKVLYTSGYTDDALLHHGVGNGTSNFLRKPFTAAELGHAVYRVLADESVAIVAGGLGGRAT